MLSAACLGEQEAAAPFAASAPRPYFIDPDGRFLLAWHHPAARPGKRHASVVLCPPLGFDYACAYRAWRLLADRIAALGFDAFRFDYDGTGESAGNPEEPDRPGAWLRSVDAVIDAAQSTTASGAIALVGFDVGAMLAIQAAARRGGVDRLVLWSAFSHGRACLRALRALECFGREEHVPEVAAQPDIHAAGYPVTAATAATLARWDIDAIATRPASDVLLVDRDDRPDDAGTAVRLETLGSRVSRVRVSGTADMLAQPVFSKVPLHALDAICDWLNEWRPRREVAARVSRRPLPSAGIARGEGFVERLVRFGPSNRLFGSVTAPPGAQVPRSCVVLLTTGTEHRVGPSRMYVPLARAWAAAGRYVLRYDLGGVGDSAPAPGADENVVYPAGAIDDLREALALVEREAPGRRVIVVGLCSGGWHALQAARVGLRLDAVAAINSPLFVREGPRGAAWLDERKDFIRYSRALRDPAKWTKALKGRLSYRHFAQLAAASAGRALARPLRQVLRRQPGGLAGELEEISVRRISTLLVFSRGDSGLQYFELCTPASWRRGRGREAFAPVVIEAAGHTFRPPAAQRALCQVLTDFVAREEQQ
ncbi:MAG TPA: alpha/beta fold hydrolase [Vicinamibacterales bacterium]|jgi:alpha-beta hydrolase superfamily lysophospholipase|nr:alpha/beta fold hydrolase [Vicinamibacterales bacterium]